MKGAVKHPGALTRQAKAAGMTVAEFAAHPPKGISATTKRRIALYKTFKRANSK